MAKTNAPVKEPIDNMMTLEGILDNIGSPDFFNMLRDYLDILPHSRDSVDELLEAVLQYDIIEIYDKLLIEYEDLLLEEEKERLKSDYNIVFDSFEIKTCEE